MRTLVFILVTLLPLLADIGHVGAYSGSAKLVRKGVITEIQSGLVLQKSDSIITASQSKVQLIMEDETIITIGPLSHFEIDSYQFEPNKKSNLSLRLQRGFFRSITGKIGKVAPERFKIHTKSATIGVRGTDFAAYVDEQSEYIGCFNGAITVTAGEKNFEVDAHMMISLIEISKNSSPCSSPTNANHRISRRSNRRLIRQSSTILPNRNGSKTPISRSHRVTTSRRPLRLSSFPR